MIGIIKCLSRVTKSRSGRGEIVVMVDARVLEVWLPRVGWR